jgi:hypothetical protein
MLYRKQSGPGNLWLTAGTALVALILGFVGGRLTAPQATLSSLLQPATLHLRQASGALDIVALEYRRAVQGNAESQAASLKAVQAAHTEVAQATPLNRLFPDQVTALDRAFSGLEEAVKQQQTEPAVRSRLDAVRTELDGLTRRAQIDR